MNLRREPEEVGGNFEERKTLRSACPLPGFIMKNISENLYIHFNKLKNVILDYLFYF